MKNIYMKTRIWRCIFGALVFASVLQSCQTKVETPSGAAYPILFGSLESRATADLDDLKKDGFMVWAYFEGNLGGTSFEKKVTYNTSQSIWAYEPLEYWIPNTKYWFKAFYPAEPVAGELAIDCTNQNLDVTITGFDVANYQEDIMIASAERTVPEDSDVPSEGSVVTLSFNHLLANIEIKIKSAVSGITINNITIEHADNKANYSSTEGWVSTATADIQISSGVSLTVGDDYKAVTGNGILVIPASSAGKTLVIDASNKIYRIDFPSDIEWESGVKYVYTMDIKQSNIIFNEPSVEKWDSENATGSVIIK